jgi:hypothetical protein
MEVPFFGGGDCSQRRIPSLAGQDASANVNIDGALRDQGEKGMSCEAVLQIDSRACDRKRIALLPPVQTGGEPLPPS